MPQLEAHHLLRGSQVDQLLLLGLPALLDEVLQEEGVLAHALDGLQEVGGQVHLVPQLHLLELRAKAEVPKTGVVPGHWGLFNTAGSGHLLHMWPFQDAPPPADPSSCPVASFLPPEPEPTALAMRLALACVPMANPPPLDPPGCCSSCLL